jgi:hypothetical protein
VVAPELPVNSFRRWFGASTITYRRGAEFKLDIGFNKLAVASRVDLHVSRIKITDAKTSISDMVAKVQTSRSLAFAV